MLRIILIALAAFGIATGAQAQGYQRIEIIDLKVDGDEMREKRVEFFAKLHAFNNSFYLEDPSVDYDANPVEAAMRSAPKDHLRYVLENCSDPCRVLVRGRVTRAHFGPGLDIHQVVDPSSVPLYAD